MGHKLSLVPPVATARHTMSRDEVRAELERMRDDYKSGDREHEVIGFLLEADAPLDSRTAAWQYIAGKVRSVNRREQREWQDALHVVWHHIHARGGPHMPDAA